MARADLLLALVRAGAVGDERAFTRAAEALIAEETTKRHTVVAQQLTEALAARRSTGYSQRSGGHQGRPSTRRLVHEIEPTRKLGDLILPDFAHQVCRDLVEEHHRRDLLRSYGKEPRHRLLLTGPPGGGKTSLAEAIATEVMAPLLSVRYSELIGSYLGETASRLQELFDSVRNRPCVLFFDEFDAVAKERGDSHETGEIKRVVSSLLLQVDELPSYVIVVAATNHHELLDRAVWRRMQIRLTLPHSSRIGRQRWIENWEAATGRDLGLAPRTIADRLSDASYAELEDFVDDVERRQILSGIAQDSADIVKRCLDEWQKRAKSSDG